MWKSFHRLAGVKADELAVIVATQATTAATETEDIRMLRDAVLVRSIGEGALFKYLWGVGVSVFECHGAGWTVQTTSRTRPDGELPPIIFERLPTTRGTFSSERC